MEIAINTDQEGYLIHDYEWSETVAHYIAKKENILLTPLHWQLILYLRDFYEQYKHVPNQRAFINFIRQKGNDNFSSATLHNFFPESPLRILAKLAGLPKPTHCL